MLGYASVRTIMAACGLALGAATIASASNVENEDTANLIQAGAGQVPYVGAVLSPLAGMIFTAPDPLDQLRVDLMEYVDLSLANEAQALIADRAEGWRKVLQEALDDRDAGETDRAARTLETLITLISVEAETFERHMREANSDAYLAMYGAMALLHITIMDAYAELTYGDAWPADCYAEDTSPACRYERRMAQQVVAYRVEAIREGWRSGDRRAALVTNVYWGSSEMLYQPTGETSDESCVVPVDINAYSSGSAGPSNSDLGFYDSRPCIFIAVAEAPNMEGGTRIVGEAGLLVVGTQWGTRDDYASQVRQRAENFWHDSIDVPLSAFDLWELKP